MARGKRIRDERPREQAEPQRQAAQQIAQIGAEHSEDVFDDNYKPSGQDEAESQDDEPPQKKVKTGHIPPERKVRFAMVKKKLQDSFFEDNLEPAAELLRTKRRAEYMGPSDDHIVTRKPPGWTEAEEGEILERWQAEQGDWAIKESHILWINLYKHCYDFFRCTPLEIFRSEQKVQKGMGHMPKLTQADLKAVSRIVLHDAWTGPRKCDELVLAIQYSVILRTRDHRSWEHLYRHRERYHFLAEMCAVLEETPLPGRQLRKVACDRLEGRGVPLTTLAHIFCALEVAIKDGRTAPIVGNSQEVYEVTSKDIANVETALNTLVNPDTGLVSRVSTSILPEMLGSVNTSHYHIKSHKTGNIHTYHKFSVLSILRERLRAAVDQYPLADAAPVADADIEMGQVHDASDQGPSSPYQLSPGEAEYQADFEVEGYQPLGIGDDDAPETEGYEPVGGDDTPVASDRGRSPSLELEQSGAEMGADRGEVLDLDMEVYQSIEGDDAPVASDRGRSPSVELGQSPEFEMGEVPEMRDAPVASDPSGGRRSTSPQGAVQEPAHEWLQPRGVQPAQGAQPNVQAVGAPADAPVAATGPESQAASQAPPRADQSSGQTAVGPAQGLVQEVPESPGKSSAPFPRLTSHVSESSEADNVPQDARPVLPNLRRLSI